MTQLQPNHPMLLDGFSDGFRAPALAWIGTQRETQLASEMFDTSSLLFSNWWVGPQEKIRAFADALVEDFTNSLKVMTPVEDGDEFVPVVSVCYWEDPNTGLALLGQVSITEDYMLGHEFPRDFTNSTPLFLDEDVSLLGFDGNDNSPHTLVNSIRTEIKDRSRHADIVSLVILASEDGMDEELQEIYDEGA